MYAHRGGAALAPENTLAAFDHARQLGVDGFELDVRLSSDGVPVVIHDATLDRTTDRTGPVGRNTAAELAQLDAGYRFAPSQGFPARGCGYGIPTLAAVLDRFPTTRVIVELKGTDTTLGPRTVEVIRAAGAVDRALLGGFDLRVLRAARACEPRLPCGAATPEIRKALYLSWLGMSPGAAAYHVFQVPERSGVRRVVSARFVRAAHRGGVPVYVWTVNTRADMTRLLGWGVDGLITDRPDLAINLVRGQRQENRR